jgi:hypothetical protein
LEVVSNFWMVSRIRLSRQTFVVDRGEDSKAREFEAECEAATARKQVDGRESPGTAAIMVRTETIVSAVQCRWLPSLVKRSILLR